MVVAVEIVKGSALGPSTDYLKIGQHIIQVAGVGAEWFFGLPCTDGEGGETACVVLALGGNHIVGGVGDGGGCGRAGGRRCEGLGDESAGDQVVGVHGFSLLGRLSGKAHGLFGVGL